MDRYTQHDRFGHFVPLASAECGEWTLAGKFEKRLYGDAASRLAAYEDTGLRSGENLNKYSNWQWRGTEGKA